MPRIRAGFEEPSLTGSGGHFAERLADELKSTREFGQPMIYEREFPSGKLRVLVIWDAWDHVPTEDRTAAIHRAYELAEGREYRDRIGLASGLTVLEAHAAGMLPYQIIAAVRKTDPVTIEQCREAMLAEGASKLVNPDVPPLWFPTEEEAEACRKRLIQRLPASEPVWIINREILPADFARAQDAGAW
jgi:hypothetical protein